MMEEANKFGKPLYRTNQCQSTLTIQKAEVNFRASDSPGVAEVTAKDR
jgi:hypothetical protein